MRLTALDPEVHGAAARRLCVAGLPFDRVDVVVDEKLFGLDPRQSRAVGVMEAGELIGVMAQAGRWVKILVVAESHRRRGIGRLLIDDAAQAAPGKALRLVDHPGNYLAPGLDVRYSDGIAFASRLGFVSRGEVENIRVPLVDNPLVDATRSAAADARATDHGYAIRRVTDGDRPALMSYVSTAFAPLWAFEVGRALDGPRRAVHAVFRNDVPVAFAAADGNNQGLGWFGPAGTDPDHRGRGLGEALLLRCLLDVRGLPEGGVIAWIGPKPFYARAAGAVDDRRFLSLERPA